MITELNAFSVDEKKRTSNRDRKLSSRLNECTTNITTWAQKEHWHKRRTEIN